MAVLDDAPITCPECGASPMTRVGEIVDRVMIVDAPATGDAVPIVVDETAWFRCGTCGHEVTLKARF